MIFTIHIREWASVSLVSAIIFLYSLCGAFGESDPRPQLVGEWVLEDGTLRISITAGGEIWNHPRYGRALIRLPNDDAELKVYYENQGPICSYKLTRDSSGSVIWLGAAHPSQPPEQCPTGRWTRYDRPTDNLTALKDQVTHLVDTLQAQQSKHSEETAILTERLSKLEAELQQKQKTIEEALRPQRASLAPSIVPRTYQQPSFHCEKATLPIERLLCADADLAEADGRMGQVYNDLYNRAYDKPAFRQAQINWMSLRLLVCNIPRAGTVDVNGLSPAKPCVLRLTQERTRALQSH